MPRHHAETPSLTQAGGPGRNFDCAGLRHRRGRNHSRVAITLRVAARTQVANENAHRTHDCDDQGYDHRYRVAAHDSLLREDLHVLLNSLLDVRNDVGSQSAVTIKFN